MTTSTQIKKSTRSRLERSLARSGGSRSTSSSSKACHSSLKTAAQQPTGDADAARSGRCAENGRLHVCQYASLGARGRAARCTRLPACSPASSRRRLPFRRQRMPTACSVSISAACRDVFHMGMIRRRRLADKSRLRTSQSRPETLLPRLDPLHRYT